MAQPVGQHQDGGREEGRTMAYRLTCRSIPPISLRGVGGKEEKIREEKGDIAQGFDKKSHPEEDQPQHQPLHQGLLEVKILF